MYYACRAQKVRSCNRPPYERERESGSRKGRKLALEGLETRLALSTVVESSFDPCPAISTEPEPEFVEASIAVESLTEAETQLPEQGQFVGPLEVDSYFQSIGASETTPITAEGEEGSSPAPIIWTFNAHRSGNYWVLTGTVTDNPDPSQCRVYFDGILQGQSAAVMPNGTFTHYAYYTPGMTTVINAVAKDLDGNESNVMSVLLM